MSNDCFHIPQIPYDVAEDDWWSHFFKKMGFPMRRVGNPKFMFAITKGKQGYAVF